MAAIVDAAAPPPEGEYVYILVPGDPAKPMIELTHRTNTTLEDDDLREVLKARFAKDALSEQQLDAYCENLKAQIHAKSPTTEVKDSQLMAIATNVNVDTFAMTVPTRDAPEAVSLYCDEKGVAKNLPINDRACGLASALGHAAQQFRGDCFISRYFDDEDAWVRRNFRLADCSTDAAWVKAAADAAAKRQSPGGMASLSAMYEQLGSTAGGGQPIKIDAREEERKFMEAEHDAGAYAWSQTDGEVEVKATLPDNCGKPLVFISRSKLRVSTSDAAVVDVDLFAAVDVDASTWYRDGNTVVVALEKARGGRWDDLAKGA